MAKMKTTRFDVSVNDVVEEFAEKLLFWGMWYNVRDNRYL